MSWSGWRPCRSTANPFEGVYLPYTFTEQTVTAILALLTAVCEFVVGALRGIAEFDRQMRGIWGEERPERPISPYHFCVDSDRGSAAPSPAKGAMTVDLGGVKYVVPLHRD